MLYTTYFAKLRYLPEGVTPVSICAKAPNWWNGLQYKKLAPKYETLMCYKETHDIDQYVKDYTESVLNRVSVQEVISELKKAIPCGDIALVCFEKSSDFCHRHLVRKWLNENGIECEEIYGV